MLLIPGLRCLCGVSETPITDPLATPTVIKDSCEVNYPTLPREYIVSKTLRNLNFKGAINEISSDSLCKNS